MYPDLPIPFPRPTENNPFHFGPYHLVGCVHHSQVNLVYQARDRQGRQVAVHFSASLPWDGYLLEKCAALEKNLVPGVLPVIAQGKTPNNQPFYVTRWIWGTSFEQMLEKKGLSLQARINHFLELCAIIQRLHHLGLVVPRLRPSKIIFEENCKIQLLDLGTATKGELDHYYQVGRNFDWIHQKRKKQSTVPTIEEWKQRDTFLLANLFLYMIAQKPLALSISKPQELKSAMEEWRALMSEDRRFDPLISALFGKRRYQGLMKSPDALSAWIEICLQSPTSKPVPVPRPAKSRSHFLWITILLFLLWTNHKLLTSNDESWLRGFLEKTGWLALTSDGASQPPLHYE